MSIVQFPNPDTGLFQIVLPEQVADILLREGPRVKNRYMKNLGGDPMKEDYQEALDRLLEHEGGYSNDVGDPGGPTKYGITIHDVWMYINPNATARDVRNLTLDQAKEIYRTKYWAKVKGDQLPPGVDYAVFDYGVNSGVVRAARVLQRIVGVEQDGKIGPITLAATANKNPAELVNAISDERLHFLQGLKTWKLFGKGWGRRVREVRAAALAMVKKAQQEENYIQMQAEARSM